MTTSSPTLPRTIAPPTWINFLRSELAFRSGFYSRFGRVVMTIVITFLIAATFRMPYAAIALYSVFTIDRSSRRAALVRSAESLVAISLGVVMALAGVVFFAQFPMATFVYYAIELFLAAFLIRTTRLQGPAMNMSMAIYSVHNVWEQPYPAGRHIEQTLWVWLTLCLGFVVSLAVEFALVREDPFREIQRELQNRIWAVSNLVRAFADKPNEAPQAAERVISYANASTAAIRERIVHLRNSHPSQEDRSLAMSTVTALVARLVDISATLDTRVVVSHRDGARLRLLSSELNRIAAALDHPESVIAADYAPPSDPNSRLTQLPELERSVALIPAVFSARESQHSNDAASLTTREPTRIFVPDAFTNPGYLQFALKVMLAAVLCYITYSALDWPGLSTSVVTCLVTGLNTIGATRQKQILRLTGAICGGVIALLSIVFILPETESITAVMLLVAAVSAWSAWFALSSTRLSYFGLQTALAFYLALIQDYGSNTQLAPARDRALGVLLGLAMMWLVFENLWPVSAVEHMRAGLSRNLRLLGRLMTAPDTGELEAVIERIRDSRDRIQEGLTAVQGHADSVLFEIGSPQHVQHLATREATLRLQATLRTLFVIEIAICQYRTQAAPRDRPREIIEAQRVFDNEFCRRLDEFASAIGETDVPSVPDSLQSSLQRLGQTVVSWQTGVKDPWFATRIPGMMTLYHRAADLAYDVEAQLTGSWMAKNTSHQVPNQ